MSDNLGKATVGRRKFLTNAVVAGAATTLPAANTSAHAAETAPRADETAPRAARGAAPPSAAEHAAEFEIPNQQTAAATTAPTAVHGSDFMVDVIKTLDIDYVFSNPGSSFLGLHESVVNYGGNRSPEFITCMHEESSAAMANGYYKAAGKPAMIMCHGTVGLQHAAMGLYNAWCDRVPMIVIGGNTVNSTDRLGANDWRHSAQDPAALVRDFTKWDDQPASLQAFADALVYGYKVSTTPPMEPIVLSVDSTLQETEFPNRSELTIPKYSPTLPPQGDVSAVRETAKWLVNAERPLIITDRMARTPDGMKYLVELAELINVPVIDIASRQNMPTRHYLNHTFNRAKLIGQADLIVGLEVTDFWGQINQIIREDFSSEPRIKPGTKLVTIGVNGLYMKSNYQDFQRYAPVDLSIAGDAEATLPTLIEEVKKAMSRSRRSALAGRADSFRKMHADTFESFRQAVTNGWNSSPVSTGRMCMELWNQIKNEDWALVSVGASEAFVSNWPHKLWDFDQHYRYMGVGAGGGVGYGLPGAVGAALANKEKGRLSVNIQCDGDFMYANGALWTAAHHKIPLLSVMHNNRGYCQETMLVQGTGNRRNRGVNNAHIGTAITNPNINYAKLAEGMGVYAEGPIEDPDQLAPALKRAIEVVKSGAPALVDVVTQVR